MNKVLRLTALVATVAALAVPATEATAAPVNATADATAKARILKPLVLTEHRRTSISVSSSWPARGLTRRPSALIGRTCFDCDGNSGNVDCSGAHVRASYNVAGTQGQNVTIASGPVLAQQRGTDTLTLDAGSQHDGGARQFGRAGHRLLGRRLAQRSEHDRRTALHGHLRPDRRLSVSR